MRSLIHFFYLVLQGFIMLNFHWSLRKKLKHLGVPPSLNAIQNQWEKKSNTIRNEPHNAKQEKAARLSEGEGSLREKCLPRVKIPNVNLRDILRLLGAPNQRSIWPNFNQFSPKFTYAPWGRYYVSWKVPTNEIWAINYIDWDLSTNVVSLVPLQSFQISNIYFFSVFYIGYEWQLVYYVGFELTDIVSLQIFTNMSPFFSLHRFFVNWHIILL